MRVVLELVEQDRADVVARRDHALDRHRSLGDEQLVTFDLSAGDGVLELAIVGEPRIVGVHDPHGHAASLRRPR